MNTRHEPVIYITREIERALGTEPSALYHIISNRTTYGEAVQRQFPKYVTLIEDGTGDTAGTGDLMNHPGTIEVVSRVAAETGKRPHILVFKNTARIEPIARAHGWSLLNPPAAASEKVENKISQVLWLGPLEKFLPTHRIEFMKNLSWIGRPFVLQWAHGHTGAGTLLVRTAGELATLTEKFPERRARITEYVSGPSFTVNVIVTPDRVIQSSPSYQITGLLPFTDSPFSTVGNDWGLARTLLGTDDRAVITNLVAELGAKMQRESWRGLFGIDLIKDDATGKLYFIEVNARQPASTTYESHLQETRRRTQGTKGLTTFEAHLAALLGEPVTEPLIEVTDGAQVIQRVTVQRKSIKAEVMGNLELGGLRAIPYDNTELNADLIRIQSPTSIMEAHNKLNQAGMDIVTSLL